MSAAMWGGVHTSKVSFASVLAQHHSVNFAAPIRNKAFDLTLRLWQTVRINPCIIVTFHP
jgi:hypothetical protein